MVHSGQWRWSFYLISRQLSKVRVSYVSSPANFMCFLHRLCIFQLYLEFMWRNSIFLIKSLLIYDSRSILKCSHGTFVTFIQENGVQRGKLQFLGFFNNNFWHKMSTLNEISSCIGTPRGLVWYMLFLDLLSAKQCVRFLIELIEQILHTIKVGEILWSQAVYT